MLSERAWDFMTAKRNLDNLIAIRFTYMCRIFFSFAKSLRQYILAMKTKEVNNVLVTSRCVNLVTFFNCTYKHFDLTN